MEQNQPGNAISRLGLGCVTFGREIDQKTSFAIMDYAFSKGINFFDTAAAYGGGASEQIVGAWMKDRNPTEKSVIMATKVLPSFEPSALRLSVEHSLNRLQTEALDVLYLHRWDESLQSPEPWAVLDSLVKEGKVKALGVSNFNSTQLADALVIQKEGRLTGMKFIQNNHNLAVSDVTDDLILICKENDINIITFSPLGAGFLTGKHQHGIEEGSRFALMPAHQDIYFNDLAQKRLAKLLEVAARTGYSATHLALAWAIHQPDVTSVLIGGRTIAHLDQAFDACSYYSSELFKELENT
ncbi:MAG TPA: aldo/keto reductase [Sphingobacteriaceae bacterium]